MSPPARSAGDVIYPPDQTPFTIRQLDEVTWLVRENDVYGEYPHIYIRKYISDNDTGSSVFIITDTGVGTSIPSHNHRIASYGKQNVNIATFIAQHISTAKDIPYVMILSHCHYDHILGLSSLLAHPGGAYVLSSSHLPSFTAPYANLQKHSLCQSMGLHAPRYATSISARDGERITFAHPNGSSMELPVLTIHTPGHTPDSLSWFDTVERRLYVGDSFYSQSSWDSEHAPWGSEGQAPILFPSEGDLCDWWASVEKLRRLVEEWNQQGSKVRMVAGHVDVDVDAEQCLDDVRKFIARVLKDEVKFEEREEKRGERFGMWMEEDGRFALGAPVRLVEDGREKIPREQWAR